MIWTIEFYNSKVRTQTLELPEGIVANLIRTLDLVKEFGPNLGRPHTAPLGKGLFEIRAKGKEGIARSFFCSVHHDEDHHPAHHYQKRNESPEKRYGACNQENEGDTKWLKI
ncbi:type II toxin-antitoxin system RelE/ParE family toxin [uncultured Desulfobacter sp.]|uniref:type II toxin-antitoxin system RelE/ParE family toxin n=1 Tax=uncultured Desulfobacter sp. TaxID=240139 RepID=UPI0029F5C81F|nr:type II toxin-antitoxin system RelE/ParE family toxin [uncultured Desulfobacter sp.]